MAKKIKSIGLPKSNLLLKGFAHDINGNMTVKLSFYTGRGFSIQTNGVMPKTDSLSRIRINRDYLNKLTVGELSDIETEVCSYIKKYGSPDQKKRLKTY